MSFHAIPRKAVGSSNVMHHKPSDHADESEQLHSAYSPSRKQEHYIFGTKNDTADPEFASSADEVAQPLQDKEAKTETHSVKRNGGEGWHNRLLSQLQAWWQEVSCCFLAAVLFIGLVVLLKHYDRRERPNWADGLTINTVVAIIATMCRALTVIPISEGLSQLKWNAFSKRERPVSDLYAFDQASRGPLGSFLLLFKIRGRLLGFGTLAAAVLISGLATSPLTQASISTAPPPVRQVESATVQRSINPEAWNTADSRLIERAAYQAIIAASPLHESYHYQQVEPVCPVGDCHWDPFNSLGACAAIANITGDLESHKTDDDTARAVLGQYYTEDREVFNVTLSSRMGQPYTVFDNGGHQLMGVDTAGALTRFMEKNLTKDHERVAFSIADFVYKINPRNEGDQTTYRAVRAIWHWCVHRYEINVKGGVPDTQLKKQSLSVQSADDPATDIVITDDDQTETFRPWPVRVPLRGLDGNLSAVNPILENVMNFMFAVTDPEDTESLYEDPSNRLLDLADDVALGMTAHFRSIEDAKNGTLKGFAGIGGDIIVVRWGWLSLLGAQIILTMLFLVYVVANTTRAGVEIVKSSNIADLMAIDEGRKHATDGSGMQKAAIGGGIASKVDESLRGLLVKEEGRWYLDVNGQGPSDGESPSPDRL